MQILCALGLIALTSVLPNVDELHATWIKAMSLQVLEWVIYLRYAPIKIRRMQVTLYNLSIFQRKYPCLPRHRHREKAFPILFRNFFTAEPT